MSQTQISKIQWIEGILLVERADGLVLLVKPYYPCSHRDSDGSYSRHVHFYVISKDKLTKITLEKLLDWLENGFWIDSMLWSNNEGLRTLIERFLKHKCIGALQAL